MNQELYELSNQEDLCDQAVELILEAGQEAIRERGFFTLVLTGGSSIQGLYNCLVDKSSGPDLQQLWVKTFFFLGDERWVPADHPDCNGGMARRLLLDHLGIREDQIVLIRTDLDRPDEAAVDYERAIRNFFKEKENKEKRIPSFDMIMLSMGSDGHVASLFAGTEALDEKEKMVTTSFPPHLTPAVDRVTITLPLINSARAVMMLISGDDRIDIAREIMADPVEAGKKYPAGKIRSVGHHIWLFTDS